MYKHVEFITFYFSGTTEAAKVPYYVVFVEIERKSGASEKTTIDKDKVRIAHCSRVFDVVVPQPNNVIWFLTLWTLAYFDLPI